MTAQGDSPTPTRDGTSVASVEEKPPKADTNKSTSTPEHAGGLRSYIKIFSYADTVGWVLNVLALIGAIGAGSALPLMDSLRIAFLTHLLRQDIGFFDRNESGSSVVQLTTNANLVNQGISEKLGFAVQGTATFVAAFIVAFVVQWKLTLITICIAPAILIVTSVCAGILVKQENRILHVNSIAGSLAEEVLASMKTVHAFSAFSKLTSKYDDHAKEAKRLGLTQSLNMAILYSAEFFCVYAGYGLAFWQGVRIVIFAVIVAATAMTQIAPQIIQVTKAASAAQSMWEVIDRDSPIDGLSLEGQRPDQCEGNIEFSNVSFSYPTRPQIPVLHDFTLSIPANKTTALVGPSGSACKAAYAHDFIETLPEYDTQVGERATMLSGGQKQRIAIARSIVSDPKVLILDEATSALDPQAEKIVQQALDNVSASRTTITIAHKLSTIRKADQIVVLSQGQIVEKGTHDELQAAGGTYHRLIKAQDLGTVDNDGPLPEKERNEGSTGITPAISRQQDHSKETQLVERLKAPSGRGRSLIRCLAILLRERRELWFEFIVTLVTCVVGATYPILAFVFAKVLDVFQIQSTSKMVEKGDFYALMFFVLALVILVVYGVMGWVTNVIAHVSVTKIPRLIALLTIKQCVVYTYRLEMFRDYIRQDMTFYDQPQHTTGSLVSDLATKPNSLQELLSFNVGIIIVALVNITASSILSIAVGWKLGLAVLAGAMIPMVFCGYLRIRLEFRLDDATSHRFSESAALAGEAMSAIRTVASLAIERVILEKYTTKLAGIERKSIKSLTWTMFWLALTQSLSLLSMALSFWYINPGQFVAFVGPSGHGKSSLISLLERYYNPTSGSIQLDGSDIRDMSLASYRSHLSLVQQEPVLYQGTIRENIALGLKEEATEERIYEACRQANIFDFVSSLPDGLTTSCGSRGSLFSGGQRQRIAIARALIRRPRLLLLDEATSALDTESERIVQEALDQAKDGRTTVAIAHRLSTIKHSDRIFVLVGGRVREQGTHEELLQRRGIYYEMCLGQALDKAA
ncbi:unnamed protein product [Aspergillus oryzae]|nr:unnamed protein product [Aspergillus oryzae]